MFASQENKGKRREKRENQTLNESCGLLFKMPKLLQVSSSVFFWVTKTMGVYIDHPLCETTIKPNILAKTKDKKVIHQNEVGLH